MDFNTLLKNSEVTSEKDKVGLAIYFLDKIEGKENISSSDVKREIKTSRANVSENHVLTYIRRSKIRDDFVSKPDSNDIKLTLDGIEHYKKIIDLENIGIKKREDKFIKLENVSGHFFEELIKKINICYQVRVYEAVMVLSRKLIENLLIELMRNEFGKQKIELYFNSNRKQFHNFSTLTDNFNDKKSSFQPYSGAVDQNLIDNLNEIREESNVSAHSIEIDIREKDLEDFGEKVNKIAKLLFHLKTKTET